MARNFSYVIPGQLAGCAQPGRGQDARLALEGLARRKIKAIVSLTEQPLAGALVETYGFRTLHLPVRDFTAPSQEQMDRFVEFVDQCLAEELPVAVHCGAGIGRTGVMLACYLVHRGMLPDEAIAAVRKARPGSVETREQERSIHQYHQRTAGGR